MREPGYYWVRLKEETDWMVGYYCCISGTWTWALPATINDSYWNWDSEFEIDERRIERETIRTGGDITIKGEDLKLNS